MQNEVAANLQCLWQCVAVSQQCDHVVYLGVFAHELLGQDVSGLESDVRAHRRQEATPVEGGFCHRCHSYTSHNGKQGQHNRDGWGVSKERS